MLMDLIQRFSSSKVCVSTNDILFQAIFVGNLEEKSHDTGRYISGWIAKYIEANSSDTIKGIYTRELRFGSLVIMYRIDKHA